MVFSALYRQVSLATAAPQSPATICTGRHHLYKLYGEHRLLDPLPALAPLYAPSQARPAPARPALLPPTLLPLIRPRRASRHVCGSLKTRDHAPPVNKRVLKCLTETVLVTSAGQTAPPSLSPSVLRTAHTTT